jgi:hypothetical protein
MYVAGETMKLSHRLLVVVGLALAPISALQTYSAFRLEAQQTLATYAAAQRLLQLIEDEQAGTIEGVGQILATIRQTRAVINQDWPGCQQLLDRLKTEFTSQLYILNIRASRHPQSAVCGSARASAGALFSLVGSE